MPLSKANKRNGKMQLSWPCWDISANLKCIFLASLYMCILNIATAQNVTQASNSSDIPTSLSQFNETRNGSDILMSLGSDILMSLSSVTNMSNNSSILASLSPFTDVIDNSTTTTSNYTVTLASNKTTVSTSQRPFESLKKKGFYIRSNSSRGNISPMDAFVLHFKALKKLKGNSKKVSSSPYQSQLVKAKQFLAGNQDAPDDATSGHLSSHPRGKPKKPIFCYFGSSANSRPSIGKFWPEHIDPFLCTHLVFAFVDITEDGTGLKPNNWNDLGEKGLYARTMKLKEKNPDLRILLAAGGWKIGSKPFLPVIKTEETWKTWVSNVVAYLRKYNFDGFDMDWEFPTWRGSGPEDKQKFTLLMKELYEKFAEEANYSGKDRLLLTLATASSAFYAEKSYEQSEIHKYIDYMLLMTYNFHGSGWEKQTGHHSPLLPHPLDPEGEQRELYILWAVKYWLNFGVPKEKIILGLSTYGLGWKLTDISHTGVKAPANGGSSKGKYTDESGILSLYEICENVINDDWKVQWIEEQKVPFAYGAGEWVGFDSPDSFYLKAAVIIKEDLGGAFVWSVEMDDFNGHCGGPKYPLLRTIYEVFTQSSSVSSFDSLKSIKSAPAAGHQHVQSSSAASKDGPGESHGEGHNGEEASASEHPAASSSDDGQALAGSDKDNEYSNYYPYDEAEAVDADATQEETEHDRDTEYSNIYTYDEAEVVDPEIFDCNSHGLGIHADPRSCHHFILCMPASPHELGSSRMSCPAGTLFDEKVKVCNHEHSVNCKH